MNIICSVQFSRSVVSNSLWPHGRQHARPPCPLPTPRVYSNSCPLNQWCHPTISSSVIPFSSCLQLFPASESFPMNSPFPIRWPKYWSFSFSISLSNEYSGLFLLGWTASISLQSKGLPSPTPQFKSINSSALSLLYGPTLTFIHNYWKKHSFD